MNKPLTDPFSSSFSLSSFMLSAPIPRLPLLLQSHTRALSTSHYRLRSFQRPRALRKLASASHSSHALSLSILAVARLFSHSTTSMESVPMKKYLIYFACGHFLFRRAELKALARLIDSPLEIHNDDIHEAFVYVSLPSDEAARAIAARCVTAKVILEVWGESETWDDLVGAVDGYQKRHPGHIAALQDDAVSYRFQTENFGKRKVPRSQQVETMSKFKFLGFRGKIDMQNAKEVYWLIADYGRCETRGNSQEAPAAPLRVFFARQVALCARELIDRYTLKKRQYLGTTSMDAELSLISANMAHVGPGSLLFDPFAGTGSFLVAGAAFGGFALGGDIDIRVLRGKEDDKNVAVNMAQYGLLEQHLGVVRFDMAKNDLFCARPLFDAIVTDPPYGVRAGARKVAMKKELVPIPMGPDGQTVPYSVSEVLTDLLSFAARTLCIGGHLAYWLPTTNEYKDSDLPLHPCFEVMDNVEQPMQIKWRRRLIVMKKVIAYDPALHENVQMSYDPYNEGDQDEKPAHADYAAKRMNDPKRNADVLHKPKPMKGGWTSAKRDKRAKRQKTAGGAEAADSDEKMED